jgi:hypothetical protein
MAATANLSEHTHHFIVASRERIVFRCPFFAS